MIPPRILLVPALLLVLNLVTCASYRWDKRQAGRSGTRRIPERTLLALAWLGGWLGALVAVYGHRRRHKARKLRFLLPLWLAAFTWLAVLAVVASRLLLQPPGP
ncbi:MAG TPA: DUF1294 domain-containing protein [Herpetosiphonaceae bacterium]|nr:DUF1294 domain-containing protein [Herpetosiphonaceae bacterium]